MWGADCQAGAQWDPGGTAPASAQWDLRPPRWVSLCHSSPSRVGREADPSHNRLIKDVQRTLGEQGRVDGP